MELNNIIFVYGTLMAGYSNHSVISRESHQFLGVGKTVNSYHMRYYGSAFPIVFEEGSPVAPVQGEIYRVLDETVKMLDRLESNGVMYQRKYTDISHPTRGYYQCEMYFGIPQHWKGTVEHLKVPELIEGRFVWK